MKKELDTRLIELLSQLDFHLVEFNNKSCFKSGKTLNLNGSKKAYLLLNYLTTIKSIKQVARVFKFFKSEKVSLNPTIAASSRNLIEILNIFLQGANSAFQKKAFLKLNGHEGLKTALFLNKKASNKIILKNLQDKMFLFLEFNSDLRPTNTGAYKIFGNFNDWRKIFFLALLIKHFKV